MTDIEKLIERLRAKRRDMTCDDYDAILGEAADALTRLVAPLPAEVEELVAKIRGELAHDGEMSVSDLDDAGRLLESLARENARLAAENAELRTTLNAERESRSDNGDPTLIDRLRAELASVRSALTERGVAWADRAQRALAKLAAKNAAEATERVIDLGREPRSPADVFRNPPSFAADEGEAK